MDRPSTSTSKSSVPPLPWEPPSEGQSLAQDIIARLREDRSVAIRVRVSLIEEKGENLR